MRVLRFIASFLVAVCLSPRGAMAHLQYNYTKFRYDRSILSRELGGSLRYSGRQVVLSDAC